MYNRFIVTILFCLLFAVQSFAADGTGLQIRADRPGAKVTLERELDDSKALISVSDNTNKPMFGMTVRDFVVTAAGRTAKITSVQPISESLEVPRNIVLVLDNSDSMSQRNAVEPLLAGVDELLKIVRPIDKLQIVVFSRDEVRIGGRDLRVRTFTSNQATELKNFVAKVYRDGMTSTTVLYEGMLAGLDLVRKMPVNEPRFMVVFSDGEDLNSAYKENDVIKATEGIGRFHAYGIDYMPGVAIDPFLAKFSEGNQGEVWKATTETNLVPIFQSVASKMQYYYIVSYLFPTTGSLSVSPESLTIDEVENFDASGVSQPSATGSAVARRIDNTSLTLKPAVDSAYGIARWKAVLANSDGTLAERVGEGAAGAEIIVPIKTDELEKLAAGGDIRATMEVQDSKGQTIVLTAQPVKVNLMRTTGSLTVTPASLTIDEVENFDALAPAGAGVVRRIDNASLTLNPVVNSAYGIARWKAVLANSDGTLAEKTGEGSAVAEIIVPIKTDDLGKLAAGGDIRATMEVQDSKGQTIVLAAQPVKVNLMRTTGSLAVAPASLTIEEIKTIDSSPMLGYVYFAEGSGEIPAQYIHLTSSGETEAFDEQLFRDTLEKYYQVLNIIGKRLASRPEATITIVGCNSDTGVEKNKKKLSAARAEAVKDYLQTFWNIAPERMKTEARNLPVKPSARNLKEGQAENRRVEIQSSDLEILAPIRSTYFSTRIDTKALTLGTVVNAANGVARWTVSVANSKEVLGTLSGEGAPPAEVRVPLKTSNLNEMAVSGDLKVSMTVEDRKKQELSMTAVPVKVNFIKTSQRLAEKQDFRVQEKYALILFEFDSDAISAGNQEIVNRIIARIKELPDAKAEITGHTDNIGKESYNVKLSERRALAVYKLLTAAYGDDPGERIRYRGVGPNEPLYDNVTPESRAFNRTVTITLEYMTKE